MIKDFSELQIKPIEKGLKGEKIKPKKIINEQIIVHKYKIKDSKYEGKCLHMEIEFKGERRVVFTGSGYLIEMIQQIPEDNFPFRTVIIQREDDSYVFKTAKNNSESRLN